MSTIKLHIRRKGNSFNLAAQIVASILTKKYGGFIIIRGLRRDIRKLIDDRSNNFDIRIICDATHNQTISKHHVENRGTT